MNTCYWCLMWAHNYWLFWDNRERYKDEDTTTLRVGSKGKAWDLPFSEVFDVLGSLGGVSRSRTDDVRWYWQQVAGYTYRSEGVPMLVKYREILSPVYHTALNGGITWPWSGAMLTKSNVSLSAEPA